MTFKHLAGHLKPMIILNWYFNQVNKYLLIVLQMN